MPGAQKVPRAESDAVAGKCAERKRRAEIDATFGVAFTGYYRKRGWIARAAVSWRSCSNKRPFDSGKPVDAAKAKLVVHTDHASKECKNWARRS